MSLFLLCCGHPQVATIKKPPSESPLEDLPSPLLSVPWRQVFWLSRPFSGLPTPIERSSGSSMLKEFPYWPGRDDSGGSAPDLHRLPFCAFGTVKVFENIGFI